PALPGAKHFGIATWYCARQESGVGPRRHALRSALAARTQARVASLNGCGSSVVVVVEVVAVVVVLALTVVVVWARADPMPTISIATVAIAAATPFDVGHILDL